MGHFLAKNGAIFGLIFDQKPRAASVLGLKNGVIFGPIFGQFFGQFLVKKLINFWPKIGQKLGQFLAKFLANFWGQKLGPIFGGFWSKMGPIFGPILAKNPVSRPFLPKTPNFGVPDSAGVRPFLSHFGFDFWPKILGSVQNSTF